MQESTEVQEVWVILPNVYEKWVNPSNRNDKHYRPIYVSNTGKRRVGEEQFKRASDVLDYADSQTRRETDAVRGQGD